MFLHHTVVVPVNGITKPAAGALVYATTICEDVRAVYVEVDPDTSAELRRRWEDWDIGVELVVHAVAVPVDAAAARRLRERT